MPTDTLTRLESLMQTLDMSVTKEEFATNLENLLTFVDRVEQRWNVNLDQFEQLALSLAQKVQGDHDASLGELKAFFDKAGAAEVLARLEREHGERMAAVDEKVGSLKDGAPGPRGPQGPRGPAGSPDTPDEVVEKVNLAKTKIKSSQIDGLDEKLARLHKQSTTVSRPMGMRKVPIVKRHRLTDQCDGVTKTFTLPQDTIDVLGVFGSQFPIQYDPTGDWTFSGRTLTLGASVSAPASGQTLWALIEVLFY